ncbi:helix-turn-helix domain-containing protein [Spirosoma flavum]|uniref:Helix-turn-helix domain-containing protein n=1 Tax=Spirosoma flavum TaxID=2048557 RepID=A0ABW6AJH6_9BACT
MPSEAGLSAARACGRQGGRPKGMTKEASDKAQAVRTLCEKREKSAQEIAKLLGISRAKVYPYMALQPLSYSLIDR